MILSWARNVRETCILPLGHDPIVGVGNGWNYHRIYGEINGTGKLSVGMGESSLNRGYQVLDGGKVEGFSSIETGTLRYSNAVFDLSSTPTVTVLGPLLIQNNSNLTAPESLTINGFLTTDATSTFTHNNGTVAFTGIANAVNGNNTFYNLTKVATEPSTLTFAANSTQTISGSLTLRGVNQDNLLALVSSVPGTQWNIDVQGQQSLRYLSFQDGNNVGANVLLAYDSQDLGDNSNIQFAAFPVPNPPAANENSANINGLANTGVNKATLLSISVASVAIGAIFLTLRKYVF